MPSVKIYLLIFSLVLLSVLSYGQEEQEPYSSELVFGVNLNTNAGIIGGIMGRHSKLIGKKQYRTLSAEIVNIKHSKELRTQGFYTGNPFIYKKLNQLLVIRPQYGREFILFNKAEEEGIQVDLLVAAGPSIGLVKPYYIEFDYGTFTRNEPYDPAKHDPYLTRINGSGGIFNGFDEISFRPGVHFKGSISFEFGSFTRSVSGVEVGGLVEFFPKEIIIISGAPNHRAFSSIFINIYYGSRR